MSVTETMPRPPVSGIARTLALGIARGRLELRQFFRGRESVVFTLLFPPLLLVIFGSVFGSNEIAPGVKFARYFVARACSRP